MLKYMNLFIRSNLSLTQSLPAQKVISHFTRPNNRHQPFKKTLIKRKTAKRKAYPSCCRRAQYKFKNSYSDRDTHSHSLLCFGSRRQSHRTSFRQLAVLVSLLALLEKTPFLQKPIISMCYAWCIFLHMWHLSCITYQVGEEWSSRR